MKKIVKIVSAALIATCALTATFAKEIKRDWTPAKSWTVYIPGTANKKDAVKDLTKTGWLVSNHADEHWSLVASNTNKKKALKLDTLGRKNDAIVLPLSGKEKKVTVIFKAQGEVDPDSPTTPYGLFFGYLQKDGWQSILRHNSSNQFKGSFNTTRINPKNIVNDWHDYRWVWDIPEGDNSKITAKIYMDGELKHEDGAKDRTKEPDFQHEMDWEKTLLGKGNYLQFGENDGNSDGYSRYAYIIVILDEDVSEMSLEQLGAKVGADLVTNPKVNDVAPPSKRPAQKPANINIKYNEVGKEDFWEDPASVTKGKINLNRLPFSKAKTTVITANPAEENLKYAATVDPTGTAPAGNPPAGATTPVYKTITEAIEKVPSGSAIKIMSGLYNEKIKITKPGITLVGADPTTTIIYGYEADTGGIDGNLLVEVNLLPKTAPTEPGAKAPIPESPAPDCYFNAVNLTFYNKGGTWNEAWGSSERRSIALALKGVDQCYLKNCIFLGLQDTLYWRSGRVYAENCYIQGTVDYICGGATVYFDKCEIYSLEYTNGGIITAAAAADTGYKSTMAFANGYVFNSCKFSGWPSYTDAAKKVVLARGTWVGGSATGDIEVGKNVLLNCEVAPIFYADPYRNWDNVNTAAKCFFREYKSIGAGADKSRPQLTDAEAKKYDSAEKVLGFKPELR